MAFHDVQFPTDISYGATGGPTFKTVVIPSDSGYEPNRLICWDAPRLKWQVGAQTWDEPRVSALISFFRARQGKAYAFRFRDWSDYFAGMSLGPTGPVFLAAGSAQQIGTGNGSQTVFQLVKTYSSGPTSLTRKITRPISGTVQIYKAAVLVTTGFTIDYSTGLVTFSAAPTAGQVIAWGGQFDVPARFDTDEMNLSMEGLRSGNWSAIPIIEVRE